MTINIIYTFSIIIKDLLSYFLFNYCLRSRGFEPLFVKCKFTAKPLS